ncbi:unnamed protein product [Pseudo-nitzschia multistriata]|uniref:RxLR effector protein n=1 Tax=Pseudo-nitzschia multistriata TaxID=183589 RepID=A0A448ZDZ9_9STRA|nr:unnamed protein product [Pseudo-nitzschia multistriata]
MKLCSQTAILCTVLVAAAAIDVAEASDRKQHIRTSKETLKERKRNLIKVEDSVNVDTEMVRVLMGSDDMSMSMPSYSGGGGGGGSSTSNSNSSSNNNSGGGSNGTSSGGSGSGTNNGSASEDGDASGNVPSASPPGEGMQPTVAGDVEPPEPFDGSAGTGAEDSSASRRKVGVAAITTAAAIVPLLL